MLQLMTDYPLSTISSKKVKKSSHQLLQKSARQIELPPPPQKALYEHILKGQKLFIELYYQGKVLETAYNQYVEFMGGILYKRLNPKVTIFLTNSEDHELDNILQRVKRVCPECKVVSILWFEQSFQNKCKLPLDKYVLERKTKSKERLSESKEEIKIQSLKLQSFIENISEDIEGQYQEFFKNKQAKFFQFVQKNEFVQKFCLMESKDFDLGPHPNRKKVTKNDSNQKKPKRNYRATAKHTIDKDSLQIIEVKSEKKKSLQKQHQYTKDFQVVTKITNENERKLSKQKTFDRDQEEEQQKRRSESKGFDKMMQRYLKNAASSQRSIRPQIFANTSVQSQSLSQSTKMSLIEKKSIHTQAITKSKIQTITITPRYKDVKCSQAQKITQRMLEIESLRVELSQKVANRLVVVSNSKSMLTKIEEFNSSNQKNKLLYFKYVEYYTYWEFLQSSPPKHEAYFPLNQTRIIDRPLYFAMKSNFTNCPKLVSSSIVKQVIAYNNKHKDKGLKQEELNSLPFLKEMEFPVCRDVIKNKTVTFMQSDVGSEINQLIIDRVGGFWVSVQNFLNMKVDLVITSRNHVKKNDSFYLTELQFWTMLFPLNKVSKS